MRDGSPMPPLVASTTETAKPSNQELAALQKWAQQVHDALDGRPLPPCPDEAAARVEALLAERDALAAALGAALDPMPHISTPTVAGEIDRYNAWLTRLTDARGVLARLERSESALPAPSGGRVAVLEAALRDAAEIALNRDDVYGDPLLAIRDRLAGEFADEPLGAVLAGGDAAPDKPSHKTAYDLVMEASPSVSGPPVDCTNACYDGDCNCSGVSVVVGWRVDVPALRALLKPGGDAAPQTDNLGGDEVASSGGET